MSATKRINYKVGSTNLVPAKYTVDRTKVVKRGYKEMTKGEKSHRMYKKQDAWFSPYLPPTFERAYQARAHNFYNTESKLIWTAFDTPEQVGLTLHDETVKGVKGCYSPEMTEALEHWIKEARYWRCLGISKPFYDANTLRANAWTDKGMQIGTIQFSQAMRDAVMDMERAVRREELGLEANYLWDRWTPSGFIDGSRSDFLPRFEHNQYQDPDGVDVSEIDIAPYNSHEQLQERYEKLIWPDMEAFEGAFMFPSHGDLMLHDIPVDAVRNMYLTLHQAEGMATPDASAGVVSPVLQADQPTLRTLFYLCADPSLMDNLGGVSSWGDVTAALEGVQQECDEKVDAARLFFNSRDDKERVREFYEEKCGFSNFLLTPDKDITGAALSYAKDLREVTGTEWGQKLATSLTDRERIDAIGTTAFGVYSLIEEAIMEKKRKAWANRFSGDANEEKTLDYMLQNFSRRTDRKHAVNQTGPEYDREMEPIGRNVQRRILDSDKARSYREEMKREKDKMIKPANPFRFIDEKQMQTHK